MPAAEFRGSTKTRGRIAATSRKPWVRVAFFDYDNDGWMDIYLVNSGACDFFRSQKPLRNARYRNNRDGTFIDVTERSRSRGRNFRHGRRSGGFRQ